MNRVAHLANMPMALLLRQALESRLDRILDDAITVQQIPAPTFAEQQRAEYVQQRFCQIPRLTDIEIDSLYNVYGRLPGTDPGRPALLVSAHTDTVFAADTPLGIRYEADRIHGPGIGDNSLGVAALLAAADILAAHDFAPDLWFVANSREEGLGNLGGIRAVYERLAPCLGCAVVVEGMALGRIYHAGIAVRRLRIRCQGEGGHSWLHFGQPSAIHSLMRLGAAITALHVPESPRTTYNIGVIEGGTTVNTIATDASMLLDLRSESREALAKLEGAVMTLVENHRIPELTFSVDVVGDRPAGSIPRSHPLVQLAQGILNELGIRPVFESGSTDANVLLAGGLPAVTVGITQGSNAHRLDEYIEIEGVQKGMWQLLLLSAGIATGMAER